MSTKEALIWSLSQNLIVVLRFFIKNKRLSTDIFLLHFECDFQQTLSPLCYSTCSLMLPIEKRRILRWLTIDTSIQKTFVLLPKSFIQMIGFFLRVLSHNLMLGPYFNYVSM
jgi:hypothetical protein